MDAVLGERSIRDAIRAELGLQAFGDAEHAAVLPDVLAQNDTGSRARRGASWIACTIVIWGMGTLRAFVEGARARTARRAKPPGRAVTAFRRVLVTPERGGARSSRSPEDLRLASLAVRVSLA